MAATKQSQNRRRNSQRQRGPRHVEPVLDPSWRSAYAPSAEERERNSNIAHGLQRTLIVYGVCATALAVVVAILGLPTPLVGLPLALGGVFAYLEIQKTKRRVDAANELAGTLVAAFPVGGTKTDRVRLSTIVERLSATFGLDGVTGYVLEDSVPNATLLRDQDSYALLVTTGLMHDVELIELEGVVAHCMARQRLGYIAIPSMLATAKLSPSARMKYVGHIRGWAFRADEVAAATIRYPLGLQRALERTAATTPPPGSYFSSDGYDKSRWVWFDPHIDGGDVALGDVDQASVRAQALEEW